MQVEGVCTWEFGENQSTFYYRSGKLSFKYSEEVMIKAYELASKFRATIIDGSGEIYIEK